MATGTIETYLTIDHEDYTLDELSMPGCIIGQMCMLLEKPVNYSAASIGNYTNVLTLTS